MWSISLRLPTDASPAVAGEIDSLQLQVVLCCDCFDRHIRLHWIARRHVPQAERCDRAASLVGSSGTMMKRNEHVTCNRCALPHKCLNHCNCNSTFSGVIIPPRVSYSLSCIAVRSAQLSARCDGGDTAGDVTQRPRAVWFEQRPGHGVELRDGCSGVARVRAARCKPPSCYNFSPISLIPSPPQSVSVSLLYPALQPPLHPIASSYSTPLITTTFRNKPCRCR